MMNHLAGSSIQKQLFFSYKAILFVLYHSFKTLLGVELLKQNAHKLALFFNSILTIQSLSSSFKVFLIHIDSIQFHFQWEAVPMKNSQSVVYGFDKVG